MAPAQALDMLRPPELPKLTKCVLTDSKFDTEKAAKAFNIEANYAPEPAQLQTLAGWSGLKDEAAEQLADGLQLFALRAVIERDGPFGTVIVQRTPADLNQSWLALAEELGDELFLETADGNLLLNLNHPGGHGFLDALWAPYLTGAVYGIADYSFGAALAAAAGAVELNG
jgi:hypothetical protein